MNEENIPELELKLIEAIKKDDIDEVEKLISQGANVNASTGSGMTALMLAVKAPDNKYDISKILLENGADIFAADKNGKTAYEHIEEPPKPPEHHENAFEAWIYCEEHALMNYINDHKRELLFHAIEEGDLSEIKEIAKMGVHIKGALIIDKTPLMKVMRAKKSRFEIVKYLISKGVDISEKDYKGKSALDFLIIPDEPSRDDSDAHSKWLNCEENLIKKYLLDLQDN